MYPIEKVVDFFLSKSSMSPKKLQKLLYYAYAWTVALTNDKVDELNNKLFDDRIEAWVHGPVVPSIYGRYKSFGWYDIPKNEQVEENVFSGEVLDILNQVWDVYGDYSGNDLEQISHKETPWIEARKGVPAYASSNNVITDESMFIFYNEQAGN